MVRSKGIAYTVANAFLRFFDLKDGDDSSSFSKWLCAFLAVAVVSTGKLTISWGLLFAAWSLGRSVFIRLLESRVAETVLMRRDPVDGVEPTP